jgi:RimJ/RimL family protein N-acetyltransferase
LASKKLLMRGTGRVSQWRGTDASRRRPAQEIAWCVWKDLAMHPMEPVELRGALVALEPLRRDHAAGILAAADADEVFAWLPYPRPLDLPQASAWVEDALVDRDAHRRFPFAVLSATDGPVIGSTSYWDFDSKNAHVEIGSTWLSRASWRSGRNAEAKLLLMEHAFEGLGLERVSFRTDIRNERSQQAIERLGAIEEGIHRHEMRRRDGSWRDSVYYSILSTEWPDAKATLVARLTSAAGSAGFTP